MKVRDEGMDSADEVESTGDDASVWTSYSDLFTNMSIIFLVLFIFALIKAGIGHLNVIVTKKENLEYLKGKTSAREKKRVEEKRATLEKSIKEMGQYNDIISGKVLQLNHLAEKLKGQQEIISSVLEDQKKREVVVNSLKDEVDHRKREIEKSNLRITNLQSYLAEKEKLAQTVALERDQAKSDADKLRNNITTMEKKLVEINKDFKTDQETKEALIKGLNSELLQLQNEKTAVLTKAGQMENALLVKEQENEKLRNDISKTAVQLKYESQSVVQLTEEMGKLRKEMETSELNNGKLKELNRQTVAQVEDLRHRYAQLEADLTRDGKLNKSLLEKLKQETEKNDRLNAENMTLGLKVGSLGKGQEGLAGENGRLKSGLEKLKGTQKELAGKYEKLLGDYDALSEAMDKLKGQNSGLAAEREKLLVENEGLRNKLVQAQSQTQAQAQGQTQALAKTQPVVKSQAPANLVDPALARGGGLRSTLGHNIADHLKQSNLNVNIDSETGNITLEMDETFLFTNNSAILSDQAKQKLKSIIPIYTEELFKNGQVGDNIHSVNIVGHASPMFRKKFVDPGDPMPEAFDYNLGLSSKRAMEIVRYIFGKEFGDFGHRMELRKKIQAIGKSYSSPVMEGESGERCGPYDCKLSRRVEISFSLKEGNEGAINPRKP